jgi:signal peptidase I
MSENKPRKPWLAVLLSVFVIGLGHIYVGKAKKGLFLYLGQAAILLVTIPLLIFKTSIYTYLFALFIGIGYLIFCAIDVLKIAREGKYSYALLKYNKWYIYLACYIMANIIIQPTVSYYIKENSVKAYKIPSGAMLPTLLIGDHILVNRYIYKQNSPSRGDIIVFEYDKEKSIDYVKRVIATPGDEVEIRNKIIFINNVEQYSSYAIHSDSRIIQQSSSPRDNFGPVTVPENQYFVLGDNRDNSYDSRFWGFVQKGKIRGKVVQIYWSWDTTKALFSSERFSSVRWGRIGQSTEAITP